MVQGTLSRPYIDDCRNQGTGPEFRWVQWQGGFTRHLDLDQGALAALEATAGPGDSDDDDYSQAFSDSTPTVPRILAARMDSRRHHVSLDGFSRSQMLAGVSRKESRLQQAKEGFQTQDYNYLTDAAGTL